MARSRWIKPEFFKHERLADLPPLHRLLFIGLWCQADRAGRLEDRPARLKIECLPYDDVDIVSMLDDLARHPDFLIVRYEQNGQALIRIPGFRRHQNLHPREPASLLPCMDDASSCIDDACGMHMVEEYKNASSSSPGGVQRGADATAFETFWIAYPPREGVRTGKQAARAAWKRVSEADVAPLMAALERLKRTKQWTRDDGKFIPHASTFLNQRRWEDDPAPAPGKGGKDFSSWEKRA